MNILLIIIPIIAQKINNGNQSISQELVNQVIYTGNRLHELGNKMQEMSNNVIYYILNDSIVNYELLKEWLELVKTPTVKYQLAEVLYEQGHYTVADVVLANIPNQFNYSELENIEHDNYMRFHEIKNILANEGKKWDELTEDEINILRSIRDFQSGRSSAMANGVLCFYYQDCRKLEFKHPENTETKGTVI